MKTVFKSLAAVAAIAAIGATERNVLLAPEAHAAVAAVAGDDGDFGFIYEFHWRVAWSLERSGATRDGIPELIRNAGTGRPGSVAAAGIDAPAKKSPA